MNPTSAKLGAGSTFPDLELPCVDGEPLGVQMKSGWRLIVVYRGKHCPLCKQYLDTMNGLQKKFAEAGVQIVAISADPREKAQSQSKDQALSFPVGYDLSIEQMKRLGLYVSSPRSSDETDRPFAEPGTFVVNPEGKLQIVDISNAPFARPDLASLLKGLVFIREKNYPIRGTLS